MRKKQIMRKVMFAVALLIGVTIFLSCEKDELYVAEHIGEQAMTSSQGLPYNIPIINTEANYANVIYIDPSVSSEGNGSIGSPLKALPGTLQQNTAYLFKRGTTHGGISRLFNTVLLGAYGQGEKPIILGGLNVQSNSNNATFRDLDIARQRSGDYQFVLNFSHQNTSRNITIAFCKLRGIASGGIYPHYAIHHSAENLLLFNNEIFNIQNNGWWLSDRPNIRVIRNWIHNVNKGGDNSSSSTGDGIQAEHGLNGIYFAGNIIDKTNSIWKYSLMLNGTQKNNVFEYNTFYAPKVGAGGAAVRWMAHEGGIFRKNVVRSIDNNGNNLVGAFDTWDAHANKPEPYGIRDNHVLRQNGTLANVSSNGVVLHSSNTVFSSNADYNTFLSNNPGIGLYGSDITAANFWGTTENIAPVTYPIQLSANPSAGGTLNGQGTYEQGKEITVTATANEGYAFANWTENGSVVSVNASYNFTVTGSPTLVANFVQSSQTQTFQVDLASTNPGGLFNGEGTYPEGQSVTVNAFPAAGYQFVSWTEKGSVLSNKESYNFTITKDRFLEANFEPTTISEPLSGNNGNVITGNKGK